MPRDSLVPSMASFHKNIAASALFVLIVSAMLRCHVALRSGLPSSHLFASFALKNLSSTARQQFTMKVTDGNDEVSKKITAKMPVTVLSGFLGAGKVSNYSLGLQQLSL